MGEMFIGPQGNVMLDLNEYPLMKQVTFPHKHVCEQKPIFD